METPKEAVNAATLNCLQLCGNCDVAAAAVWCLDCNGGLCDKCELAHRRVSLTRNHRLHNELLEGPKTGHCVQHPAELLELICLTCKTFTCRDCQLTDHMNHRHQFVSESMANVKKYMMACVKPIRAQTDTVNRSLRDMETRLKYIKKTKSHLRSDLLHFFNMIVQHLTSKMKAIVSEIGDKCNLESERIVSRMEVMKQLQRNQTDIIETCEESQSTNEFRTVLLNWKKIKENLVVLKDQDLSPPSTMSHLIVCTQQNTAEIIERMVFLQTGWIPFAVPQEDAIKDNVAQSDTVTPAKSSSSELCSTSSTSASTSSFSSTSNFLHQNTSTYYTNAKQGTSMDSSLPVVPVGPTNVVTDPILQSSSTSSIATIHAPNKSPPSACSQKSSTKIQTRRSVKDSLGPTINQSNYNVSYPETNPLHLSSHCVNSVQMALSPHFQSGSSLSVTNPKATVSKKIQGSAQPVAPNQTANPTQSFVELTFSKHTKTVAQVPLEIRCPLITGLLDGSVSKKRVRRVPNKKKKIPDQNSVSVPSSACAQATKDPSQHLVQAPMVSIPNIVLAPMVSSPSVVQAPMVSSPNVVQAPMVSSPNVVQAPMVSSPNVVQAPMVSSPNVVQAPMVSSPNVVQAPMVSSPNVVQAPMVNSFQMALSPHFQSGSSLSVTNPKATVSKKIQGSAQPVAPNQIANPTQSIVELTFSKHTKTVAQVPLEIRCPLISGLLDVSVSKNCVRRVPNKIKKIPDQNSVSVPNSACAQATKDPSQHLVQAPMVSNPSVVLAPMVSSPSVVQAPMVSSPNVVQAPMVSNPSVVLAPMVSSPSVVQAPMVSSPNVVQAPMVSSPNVVQAPMVSSPNVVQAPMVSSPNVVQAPMVSSPNVVQAPMVSSPNVVQAPMVSSPNVVQAPMVSSPNVVQAPMVSSPNLVQAPMVSSPNLVQAPMVSSPNLVQAPIFPSSSFVQTTGVLSRNVAPIVPTWNVVQAPMVSSPDVVQAPMVSSPDVVQAPMVSSPDVVQAPMVSSPNVVQAPMVSSPNVVQAPMVSSPNLVQAPMVSSPNVVQTPMVSSPNVVQSPMVSIPNVVQAPMVSIPNVVQAPMVSSPNVVQAPMVSSPNVVQAPMVSSPNVVQAPMVSSPNVVQAPMVSSPSFVQTTGVLSRNVAPMVPTWNVVQATMVSIPNLVQAPIFPSPTFVQTTGVLGHNITPRVPSWNIVQAPMVSGPNVIQPPSFPSSNVFQALQFPTPTSMQAMDVQTQNAVEANTAPKPYQGQALRVPSPNTVSASVRSLVKTMAPRIPSLGGPCPVLTVPQTEVLPNSAALPFNNQTSLVLTNAQTLCIPVVPQFPAGTLSTLSENMSLSDDSGCKTLNTLDPVSSGDQTVGCNVHQEDNADNEPSTTVSEEPEPEPRESTTKVISEPATADNEPTSTVPEDPEPDENEPTTTTSKECEQITSTSDIEAVDEPSTAERAESGTVITHQDFNVKLFDPRVSLLRIPLSNHKPGCPPPSFHVVIGESNDQICFKKMEETKVFQSPTPHPSSDFIDLTDSPDEMDQGCVIKDTVRNSLVEDGLDLIEPLLLAESPFSLEVVSCSVCTSSESLIICSVCARGFHRHCHVPEVKSLSMFSWNCSLCQDVSNQSDPSSSERPAAPQDGLSPQDQRRCETLLLFVKVQTKSPMEQISKRLTLRQPSPYRRVAQFVSDVEKMFNDMSQDEASRDLKKRFQEKLKQTLGPELDPSPLTDGTQAVEKSDESKQKLKTLKRRLRIFLDQQKAKKIKI